MEVYLGAITMFAGNFAIRGSELCQGQLKPISQFNALFSLLGTNFGGDGRTTFGLPDMQGRAPIGMGRGPGLPNRRIGQRGGADQTTLLSINMPEHTHPVHLTPPPPQAFLSVASDTPAETTTPSPSSCLAAMAQYGRDSVAMYTDSASSMTPIQGITIAPSGDISGNMI
ncbi:phage tail protein, partial [Terasakiispira papahanaumokuakeensis]|uniref:phage tail protein n=1 Tax=Terasakiispira papahanaumokuakeensis TaxID=197479 RepID=UPI0009FC6F5C